MTTEGEPAKTSPEELLAAAHSTCFTMALGATLAAAGFPPSHLATTATHALETGAGKWRIVSAELDVRGAVEGMGAADFTRAVNEAGFSCVISQAIRGNVSISTHAELVEV
jgi:lipoyl-dependent peroxiredoxin